MRTGVSVSADSERFWSKVDKSGDCWLWTGARDGRGYGHLRRGPRNFKAHRYVLMLAGIDVTGRDVDHTCHTRACVRPDHLRLVTRKQNLENFQGARRDSKSGIRGVFWDTTLQKWTGSVNHFGKAYRKSFQTCEEASDWVLAKRLELHTHNDADRSRSCRCFA